MLAFRTIQCLLRPTRSLLSTPSRFSAMSTTRPVHEKNDKEEGKVPAREELLALPSNETATQIPLDSSVRLEDLGPVGK